MRSCERRKYHGKRELVTLFLNAPEYCKIQITSLEKNFFKNINGR